MKILAFVMLSLVFVADVMFVSSYFSDMETEELVELSETGDAEGSKEKEEEKKREMDNLIVEMMSVSYDHIVVNKFEHVCLFTHQNPHSDILTPPPQIA